MATDEHKAAFTAAAQAASQLLEKVRAKRELMAKSLAAIDAEIARLETVISFAPDAVKPGANGDKPARRERLPNGTWAIRVAEILAGRAMTMADLLVAIEAKHPGAGMKEGSLRPLLERGERMKRWRKDEERRWHIVQS